MISLAYFKESNSMGDGALYFAVKSIGMSTRCGRKPQTLLDAARHNLREIQAEYGADGHIDPIRIAQNAVMRGPPTAADVHKLANELFACAGIDPTRLRKDYCQAIELVFSLPVGSNVEHGAFFEQCLQWTCRVYALPVLLATAHHDEAAKHLHVLLLPLQKGAYVGSTPVAIPTTKERRESFFQEVAGPHGLKRSAAKLHGTVKAWAVRAVLDHIRTAGIQACAEALWPTLRAAIERDPTHAMQALQIDIHSIRPDPLEKTTEGPPKAIGFAIPGTSPIGFQSVFAADQNLSGLGLPEEGGEGSPPTVYQRFASPANKRITDPHPRPVASPARRLPPDEDGIVRERDEFCQIPNAWLD